MHQQSRPDRAPTGLQRHRRVPRRHTIRIWHRGLARLVALPLIARAGDAFPPPEVLPLPPLVVAGQPARAHTQGLEIVGTAYYVTARREDLEPKRALLLRTSPGQKDWDSWDLTPEVRDPGGPGEDKPLLDHPGGFQMAGGKLWIPLAESRRRSRSLIRAYHLPDLKPNQPARSVSEFAVDDHIGAVAVAADQSVLVGASWDTETVYLWDRSGGLRRKLTGAALAGWGLGVAAGADGRAGLAVQDWKIVGDRLLASGLRQARAGATSAAESWLVSLPAALTAGAPSAEILLPRPEGVSLAREAMAVASGSVHFLPEDLGATNRLFRFRLAALGL